ncbi:MAG: tetratricopeptide (TPR) repeat protein [Planctomycetota bacterium]|jgi:tetratricopeptide (TPR) repeat protein
MLGCLVTGIDAQKRSDEQMEADIEYARGLAQRYRFVDLAEELIVELESGRTSAPMAIKLGLAKCDIYAEGARRESDPPLRRELYDKALAAYAEFLDSNEFADERPQAERSFVDLSNAYSLVIERDLESAVGEDAEALRVRMGEVLDEGVKRTGTLLDAFADSSELNSSEKEEKWRLMLNMAQLRITQGNLSSTGTFLFNEAETILEELAVDAGETSGWGLNAYLLTSKSMLAHGAYEDAAAYAEFVVDLLIPASKEIRDDQGWDQIPQELKQARWEIVERGTPTLIEAYNLAGDRKTAVHWGLSAYNNWKEYGFDLTPRGSLAILALGDTLVDLGGWVGGSTTQGNLAWFEGETEMNDAGFTNRRETRRGVDLALSIAQEVNQTNKGNILQVYAQALIKRVRDVPGVQLDPSILYEAAEGTFYEKDYPAAIEALHGVMLSLQSRDDATRTEFMPKVHSFLGRSYAGLDRDLEAALTHREGVLSWNGDAEFDSRNAQLYYTAIGRVLNASGGDEQIQAMRLEAETLVQKFSKDEGEITWRQAERAYGEKDYAGAREKYLAVEPTSDNYDKALAKAALCLYKTGDFVRAAEEFAKFVDEYAVNPANAPTTGGGSASRAQALTQSVFYLGRIAFEAQDWATTITRLDNFNVEHPGQDSYSVNALYMVVLAHLRSTPPNFEAARSVHTVMVEEFRDNVATGRAALQIYGVLSENYTAAEAAGTVDALPKLRRDMAEMISLSNSLQSTPAWDNMRRETSLWSELEEWELAEAIARRTAEVHADRDEDLRRHVIPDLGHALLRQKRVAEAFEALDPIVPDPDSETKGAPGPVLDWCLAVTGWVEGTSTQMAEVPGIGNAENFLKASKHLLSLEQRAIARSDKWSCEYLAARLDRAYCYYRWGQIDSAHLAVAKSQIEFLQGELGPRIDAGLEKRCNGDDTVQKRLLWLYSKVR